MASNYKFLVIREVLLVFILLLALGSVASRELLDVHNRMPYDVKNRVLIGTLARKEAAPPEEIHGHHHPTPNKYV
ncbi:hypothetical protein FEM48_Zijuj03G0135300 [Ziziphus jujuba var. spinosa]|uniref:Uncharacterized protein n=1 Tax=Ziziphus jujuba var. spinosa TaxID=714518 RepID=A0A978VQL0_ZIZJJ|nr:hypothetical protein FEM48_Zijuj03G0135300 [Ziziphus jujuba var. spinosa]